MKVNWKKALYALFATGIITFFYGGLLLFLFMFGVMGAFPLYVTKVIPAAGIVSLTALILAASGYLGSRGRRRLGWGVLAVFVLSLACIGRGWYMDHIPALDDRTLLLWEYEPFTGGSKAAALEEPAAFQLDREDAWRLRLDGATALYPVYAAFVQAVYPKGHYPLYDSRFHGVGRVACSGTVEAYQRLIAGGADVIFAAGPSRAQLDIAERAGMELHLTPIGREAFVFFVNSGNPVTGLTVEQVRGIYSGEITNWNQVGGKNQRIRPFQRAENSGSQTSLQRLMGDIPLLEPEKTDVVSAMDGIIREVASYRNYRNAIGFSFRFYATEMVSSDQIRLLALDGVEPSQETIRDGSYPIASEFYAVTAAPIGRPAPRETDPALDALLDWVCSPQGQSLVDRTGYVSLYGAGE